MCILELMKYGILPRMKDQALGTLMGLSRCEDREPAKEAEGAASVIGRHPGECVSQR